MIWLPGVLSQGGKVYTWKRYTIKHEEAISENTTKEFPSTTVRYDSSYMIEGDHFVFPNDFRSNIGSLRAGRYFSTQFETMTEIYQVVSITQNGNVYTIVVKTHSLQAAANTYVDTVESRNIGDYPENGIQGDYWYVLVSSGDIPGEPEPDVNFVSYIKSTGTQHINTNFTPNQNTRIVLEVEANATSSTSSSKYMLGARASSSSRQFALQTIASNYAGRYGTQEATIVSGSISGRYTIDLNKNVHTINGITHTFNAETFTCPAPLSLFAMNNNGSGGYSPHDNMKLYSCKIYDDGVLVRYYKPCLDPDGVACLYDEVNAEYVYNAGSGTFAYGMAA
jgi:hypothetical protein